MKHKRMVHHPARDEERVYKTTCDSCGEEIREDTYEVNEVKVSHKTGHSYPEGGSGEKIIVDLCGKCFDEKLIPFLKSIGANPRTEEWDW